VSSRSGDDRLACRLLYPSLLYFFFTLRVLARAHHDWKDDGDDAELLDDAEHHDTAELNDGEQVHAAHRNVAQEHVVRLVLGWHQHHQNTLHKLHQHRQQAVSTEIGDRARVQFTVISVCDQPATQGQLSLPSLCGSINEYQLLLGRQRQVGSFRVRMNAGCAGKTMRSLKKACYTRAP